MKTYLLAGLLTSVFSFTHIAQAQTAFWSFDDNEKETFIPVQCDGQFDESRGGVYMPTPEELFEQGELFLRENGEAQKGAGYCFLSAALQGHVLAQYRVALLYNKGFIFPQNDLAAYKWAYIAALHGNKEAERLALTLEQFLSTEDIELATKSIDSILPSITQKKTEKLNEKDKDLKKKKEELERINKEIDDMLGIRFVPPEIKAPTVPDSGTSSDGKSIFSEEDRMK